MHSCHVPGCSRLVSGWSKYCPSHKTRVRRHGHPTQRAVTAKELSPYLKTIRRRIRKNAENPAWGKIEGNWEVLLKHARAFVAQCEDGRPFVAYHRTAFWQFLRLQDVPPRKVVETALAMYLMFEQDPRRFRDDDAFRFQLVRRIRLLTTANRGEYWDHKTQRVKYAYRDVAPRVVAFMGDVLVEVFGKAGLYVARLEERDLEAKRKEAEAFNADLQALK